MIRPYQDVTADSVDFFVGQEVEHTPTVGMKTLFVCGVHSPSLVINHAIHNQVSHVYFGANHSFHRVNSTDQLEQWQHMINTVLQFGMWATLDIDVSQLNLLETITCAQHNQFVPMIRVAMPNVLGLNYNAVIKIDDVDFAATNPGVWCHPLRGLTAPEQFTHWSKYTKDQIIQ
jgi:hypothetical protein